MSDRTMAPQVLAYEPDLIFSSRMESLCEEIGVEFKCVTSFEELSREMLTQKPPQLVALNLDSMADRLGQYRELVVKKKLHVIGYFSHMNADLGRAAKDMGIEVVSRGSFAKEFEERLRELIT